MIIGLSGYARSGKDEAAKGLELFGFQRVAFADVLREFLCRLNPTVLGEHPVKIYDSVQHVINRYGWDGYKETPWGPGIRELLQRLGTECGRELIGENVWVDATLGTGLVEPKNLVVTDVRFPNEAQAVKQRGGCMVRINRPGVEPANAHASETALDDWEFDYVLDNDGTVAELHQRISNVALSFIL